MKLQLTLITILLILSSCNQIISVYYGMRSPKIENEKSLNQYLEKKKINSDNILILKAESYVPTLIKANAIPTIRSFNREGVHIPYTLDSNCNSSAYAFIDSLKPNKVYTAIDSITLESEFASLTHFNGSPIDTKTIEAYDYIVFIYWNRWTGRLNKNHVKDWEESAIKNPNAKIKVYKVNTDVQESWGKENAEKALKMFVH